MKKISAAQLANERRDPRVILANSRQGASLAVPFTFSGDKILVSEAEATEVRFIRNMFAAMGLSCLNEADVIQYNPFGLSKLPVPVSKRSRLLPGEYGKSASQFSQDVNLLMDISRKRSNSITSLHIDDITKVPVSTVREAHAVANYLLALVPTVPALRLTAHNGEVFETKHFKAFDTQIKELLAGGKRVYIGISNELGKVTELSTAQVVVGESDPDHGVISVTKKEGNLDIAQDLNKWSMPEVVCRTATTMSDRGYQGVVTVTIGQTERGDKVPARVRTGLNTQFAAAYTVAKITKRDSVEPYWTEAAHPLPVMPLVDALKRLHQKGLVSTRNQFHGVVPLSTVSGKPRLLHYVAMAKSKGDLASLVQRVNGVL